MTPICEPEWSEIIWWGYWYGREAFFVPALTCLPCVVVLRRAPRIRAVAWSLLGIAVAGSIALYLMMRGVADEPALVVRSVDSVVIGAMIGSVALALGAVVRRAAHRRRFS
jgi:di/tricarboxylate transporter